MEKHFKKSHWKNVVLTDSQYPNIEYSLVDDTGKLIEFKTGEDKIPALNFTIQIVN